MNNCRLNVRNRENAGSARLLDWESGNLNGHPLKAGWEQVEDKEILTCPPPSTRKTSPHLHLQWTPACLVDNVPSMSVGENKSSEDDFDQCSGSNSGPVELWPSCFVPCRPIRFGLFLPQAQVRARPAIMLPKYNVHSPPSSSLRISRKI
jgi:hypothetical protein